MPLSDDQRALLRLLAGREEGYEDIAALKGKSVEEVRAEVKDALAQMQADEAAGAPASVPVAPRPEKPVTPTPPAEESAAAPTPPEEAPPPTPPEPVQEPPPRSQASPPSSPAAQPRAARPPRRPRPQIPAERRRMVLLAGGALAVVAVVLGAIAILGGSSDSSGSGPSETSGIAETTAESGESGKVTEAILEPADGSDASGQAVFGRVGKEEVVLQVIAENLEPTDNGQSYTVWLYRSPKLSLRVGSVAVGESGKLGARFAIPAELLAYIASGAFDQIYLSRTENAAYQAEVARAKKNKSIPRYTGETVLTGEITGPIAEAGKEGG